MSEKISIEKGSYIVCGNEHVIAIVKKNLEEGEKLEVEHFDFDKEQFPTPPINGKPFSSKCKFCRSSWVEVSVAAGHHNFHFPNVRRVN